VDALDGVLVVGAYLIGTFPTAQLVGGRRGVDPTRSGSGNPGATNVLRTAGRRAGALVFLGDVGKGAIPTAVGLAVGGRPLGVACWAAAVLGHVFPLTRRLRGGKGVATAGGGALVLYPLVGLVLLAIFALVVRVSRTASIGSIAIAAVLPVLLVVTGRPGWEVAVAAGVSVLVVVRHAENIQRLVRRDERSFGRGR
jgi:acyl phosphate:glycerol-3-phosphate acyltransferase